MNSTDHNFTDAKLKRRMEETESSISRYLTELDSVDRQEPSTAQPKRVRLEAKIAALKLQMASLKEIEAKLVDTGETQISLTDPDSRSMMTRGSGSVRHNVQTAVDAKHHLIVEPEVRNTGSDRDQLLGTAKKRARQSAPKNYLTPASPSAQMMQEQAVRRSFNNLAYLPQC